MNEHDHKTTTLCQNFNCSAQDFSYSVHPNLCNFYNMVSCRGQQFQHRPKVTAMPSPPRGPSCSQPGSRLRQLQFREVWLTLQPLTVIRRNHSTSFFSFIVPRTIWKRSCMPTIMSRLIMRLANPLPWPRVDCNLCLQRRRNESWLSHSGGVSSLLRNSERERQV